MAHALEIVGGKASMAYVGQTPWHGLGTELPEGCTPTELMVAAGLDWEVEKLPLTYNHMGRSIETGNSALVRTSDSAYMDIVPNDWEPVQNLQAFEFFESFIEEGSVTMNTAGSLQGGKRVWALAKVKDGAFNVVQGEKGGWKDRVESFLLFSNPHIYGKSVDIRLTNTRVVCQNTLTLALNVKADNMIRVKHNKKFDADMVKTTLGFSKRQTKEYADRAKFLATKNCTSEQIHEYLNKLFPINEKSVKQDRKFSQPAQKIFDQLETQPGANFGRGTFWQAFNAVTYSIDHLIGNSVDTRLTSAWYGANANKKQEALKLAVEMAS